MSGLRPGTGAVARVCERTDADGRADRRSNSTIGRTWLAFDLKPHQAASFKLSTAPLFVEKIYDIDGLYLNPPEAAVVLRVDEKSQVQALARSQPAFPTMPEQRTHDYLRPGTTSLFAAITPPMGRRSAPPTTAAARSSSRSSWSRSTARSRARRRAPGL